MRDRTEWQPIETYDALKKKPKYAVFWFKAVINERRNELTLPATAKIDRCMGRRVCTHWFEFEEPTQ